VRFEWDDRKEAQNLKNHGIDFGEGIESFDDPLALVRADPEHSRNEHRFIIIGRSRKGRVMLTVFTEKGAGIRIISSRGATRREVRNYEEGV
jgi:uncharacterized DUF497 family protein